MIRHILKIIRNERKANTWILLEFIVVFCVLWFCCDYLYYLTVCHLENPGFDINHTYTIRMNQLPNSQMTEDEKQEYIATFTSRVKQYPGVEHIAFANYAVPYSSNSSSRTFLVNEDSTYCNSALGWVTPEFFDVFNIPVKGEHFNESDKDANSRVIISPDRYGYWGTHTESIYPLTDVRVVKYSSKSNNDYVFTVIGYIPRLKRKTYDAFSPMTFFPMQRAEIDLVWKEVVIRITPSAAKDFEERFMRDMKEQLALGPYYLSSIESINKRRESSDKEQVGDNLNSVLAITAFLVVNIFLGIIGTFWSRIQSRRSEIGLRIALGASKRKVKHMLLLETFLLLFISSIIGTLICLNIGQTDLLEALGIPLANRVQVGFGSEQDFINYGITFTFLLLVSFLAVWYPATQATRVQPAESLRSE